MSVLDPQPPNSATGDIYRAHMRRAGLLPEDEEERAFREQQGVNEEPYNPNPISTIQIGEEKTYWDVAKDGFSTGLSGGAKGIVSAVESFGFGGDLTEDMIDYLDEVQVEHAPPEAIQQELRHNPWLLMDFSWWSYNIPSFAASTVPMLVGGGGAGLIAKSIARMVPGLAGSAATARTAFGGALNMMTVGGGVYAEAIEGGASHSEAASLSHASMIADAPFAFLESMLFLNPKLFAARLPKSFRATTRKGNILQSSAIESFQEAGENIFADNLITGKPWQTGVLESLIAGPAVGGPIAAFQGATGFDPAVMHAEKIETLKVGEGIEGLNDPELTPEEQVGLADRAASPALSPQRVQWLEYSMTRENIDKASAASGNPVPLTDIEWTSMLKDNLRLVGYFETDLDGRGMEELEIMLSTATKRHDRTVPIEHRTSRPMSEHTGEDTVLRGDSFVIVDPETGLPDYTKMYRVTQQGYFEIGADGEPTGTILDGVVAFDIAQEGTAELNETALKDLAVEIPATENIMVVSRSRLRGKDHKFEQVATIPEEQTEVPPLTSETSGETPPLDPKSGGAFIPGSGALMNNRLLGEGEGPPLQTPFIEGEDETAFVVTSKRDAQGKFTKPSIQDVRDKSNEIHGTKEAANPTPVRPVTEVTGEIATPAMNQYLVDEITRDVDAAIAANKPPVEELPDRDDVDVPSQAEMDAIEAAEAAEEAAEIAAEAAAEAVAAVPFLPDVVTEPSLEEFKAMSVEERIALPEDVLLELSLAETGEKQAIFVDKEAARPAAELATRIASVPDEKFISDYAATIAIEALAFGDAVAGRDISSIDPTVKEDATERALAITRVFDAEFVRRFANSPNETARIAAEMEPILRQLIPPGSMFWQAQPQTIQQRFNQMEGMLDKFAPEFKAEIQRNISSMEERQHVPALTPGSAPIKVRLENALDDREAGLSHDIPGISDAPLLPAVAPFPVPAVVEPAFLPTVAPAAEPTLDEIMDSFPEVFGLDPSVTSQAVGSVFRVERQASFLDPKLGPQIVTQVLNPEGVWVDFSRGTPEELRGLLRPVPDAPVEAPFLPPVRVLDEGVSGLDPGAPSIEALDGGSLGDIVARKAPEPASGTPEEVAPELTVDENGLTKDQAKAVARIMKQRVTSKMSSAEVQALHAEVIQAVSGTIGTKHGPAPVPGPDTVVIDPAEVMPTPEEIAAEEAAEAKTAEVAKKKQERKAAIKATATPPPAAVPDPEAVVDNVTFVNNSTDAQLANLPAPKLRTLALSVGVDPEEIKQGFYKLKYNSKKTGQKKGEWARTDPEKGFVGATRASLVYSIRQLHGQPGVTEEAEPELVVEESVEAEEQAPAPTVSLEYDPETEEEHGMSDESMAVLMGDLDVRDAVVDEREKSVPMTEEESAAYQVSMEEDMRAALYNVIPNVEQISMYDLKIMLSDGREGTYGKTSTEFTTVVWIKGQRRPVEIQTDTLQLVDTNTLREKPNRNVSDTVLAEAKALLRGTTLNNMHKKFVDGNGKVSIEMFKKFATQTLKIALPRKVTRPEIAKAVRNKLAPAKGDLKQEPTDRGNMIEGLVRAVSTPGDLEGGVAQRIVHVSGWLLQDGSFHVLNEVHHESSPKIYEQAGMEVEGVGQEPTQIAIDTGAIQVSINTGLGGSDVVYQSHGKPSRAQMMAIRSAAKRSEFLYYTLMVGNTMMEITVDQSPSVTAMQVANFYVRALEGQTGLRQSPSDYGSMLTDINSVTPPAENQPDIIYGPQELNPLADEHAEDIATVAAQFSPDTLNPRAWGRAWVMSFPNTEAARIEALRITEKNAKVTLTAKTRRQAGLERQAADVKYVLELAALKPATDTAEFVGIASKAQDVVRELVIAGDSQGLKNLQAAIRKGVNKGDPMSVVVQNAINMLQPQGLGVNFMPDPSDIAEASHVEPESWDVPLVDSLTEALAQQAFRLNINGVAPANLDNDTQISLADARKKEWYDKFGPRPTILGNGVSRSLRNPHMYKPNDDILIRTPRAKHAGYKTLLHTVQRTIKKGVMKWQGATLQSRNPLEDIAVLGQVIRDARVENHILYYINSDNIVVGSTIISSRLPNSTASAQDYGWDFVAAKAGSLGAVRVATSHNHPAGLPTPSFTDVGVIAGEQTEANKHGLEHMGHVIVDNTQYYTVDPQNLIDTIDSGVPAEAIYMKGLAGELKMLPPTIGKDLSRGVYLNPLTTPGLEAEAIAELDNSPMSIQELHDTGSYVPQLESARERVLRAHAGAGRTLSLEDSATHMHNLSVDTPRGGEGSFDWKGQVVEQATRMAHDNEVVVVVSADVTGKITSVQSVEIETLRNEELMLEILNKQTSGAYRTYVYLSSEAAARETNTAAGFDQNVEGFLKRLYEHEIVDGYATQEFTVDTDKAKSNVVQSISADEVDGLQQNFRHVYASLADDQKELVLFSFGASPGLKAGELGKEGLWKLAESNRKIFEKYKRDGEQTVVDHFVNMGANKGIDMEMLRMLSPGEDPSNMPWREMTEKSLINRRSKPKRGSMEQDTGFIAGVTRPFNKMMEVTRNHEKIPFAPDEPGVKHYREFFMGELDSTDKYTAAQETLARPETMMERMFQDFEVKDFHGLIHEVGSVIKNIGSGAGIKKSIMTGIRRVNPYMAKWLYDTDHALNVWVDLVNEHRLGTGGDLLASVANPRDALDLSRNVGGKIEQKLKEYNTILKLYGQKKADGGYLGLTDQEMLDVTVYLNALQSKRRISVARERWTRLQDTKSERATLVADIKKLKTQLKLAKLAPEQRQTIEDTLFTTTAYHAELIRESNALKKLVVEKTIKDADGKIIDKEFDVTSINPGGATEAMADLAMAEIKKRVGPDKFAQLSDVSREMNVFWDMMLDISMDAGLISRADGVHMKEANDMHGDYMAPFDIIRHYNNATMSGSGGPSNRGSMSVFDHDLYKHMVGSKSASRDPIMSAVDKISAVISFAAKNKAMKTFHDTRLLWDESGEVDPEIESVMINLSEGDEVPADFRRVHYWQDGNRVSFAVYAPMGDVLLGLNRPVAGPIMRVVKAFTKVLRAGATALSPSFIVFNVPRDLMTQYVSADEPLSPFVMDDIKLLGNSMWIAMKASWSPETVDPLLEEFMAMGAGYGGEISHNLFTDSESDSKAKKQSGALRKKKLGRDIESGDATIDKMAGTLSWMGGLFNPFGAGMSLTEALEQGTRFAVFRKQLQASGVDATFTGVKGLQTTTNSAGEIVDSEGKVITKADADARETKRQKAVFAGRRATVDFSRGGKAFLFMNMMAPFTNAAVQGVRTISGGVMKHQSRAIGMATAGVFTAIILNLMNRANYGDLLDEEEDWRRRKMFTMIVGTWKDEFGEEHPISIHAPKGDLLSALSVPFEDFVDHLYKASVDPNVGYTDNAVGGMFSTMLEMFSEASPIEFERNGAISPFLFISKFLPTPVKAILETATDTNFYFDREIEGSLKGLLTEDRYRRDTTELAKFMSGLAGSVFDITGDRETNPFSPVVIDAIIASMTGEAGGIAASLGGKTVGAILSPSEALFGVAESFDAPWMDWVETAAYSPFTKRLLSVRGGKQERLQMETLERVQQVMGSRRGAIRRPVLNLMRERRSMSSQEFMSAVGEFGPEQMSMLRTEIDREAQGLGRTESVARTLRGMSVRKWGRAIGIIELMNRHITSPTDRAELIRSLSYSGVLTPMVMSQVMLLAGNGSLRRPDGVIPGAPGLRRVDRIRELAQPEFLPYISKGRR